VIGFDINAGGGLPRIARAEPMIARIVGSFTSLRVSRYLIIFSASLLRGRGPRNARRSARHIPPDVTRTPLNAAVRYVARLKLV